MPIILLAPLIQIEVPDVVNWWCTVHRKVNWRIESRENERCGFFRVGLIDATSYFPFRLHKPPGETIERRRPLSANRRDFSPRANSLCILSRRMNTRPFLSVAQRRPALSIIEPHPRCTRTRAHLAWCVARARLNNDL